MDDRESKISRKNFNQLYRAKSWLQKHETRWSFVCEGILLTGVMARKFNHRLSDHTVRSTIVFSALVPGFATFGFSSRVDRFGLLVSFGQRFARPFIRRTCD